MKGSSEDASWNAYISGLVESGKFRGGSRLGNGKCLKKDGSSSNATVTGFMQFEAESFEEIEKFLKGNPVFEKGFEVEIHELLEEKT